METNEANQLNFRLLTPKLEPPSLLLRFPIKLYRCVIRLWVIITSLTDRDIPIYIKSVVQYCRSPSMEISKYRCNHIMYRGDTLSRLCNCCMPLISWTRKIIQKKKNDAPSFANCLCSWVCWWYKGAINGWIPKLWMHSYGSRRGTCGQSCVPLIIRPYVVAGISVLFLIRQQEQGILSSSSAVLLQKVMARK